MLIQAPKSFIRLGPYVFDYGRYLKNTEILFIPFFRLLKRKVILVLLKERVTFLLSKTFDIFIYFKKSKYFFFPRPSKVVSKSNKLNCHSLSKKSPHLLTFESRNGEEFGADPIKFC